MNNQDQGPPFPDGDKNEWLLDMAGSGAKLSRRSLLLRNHLDLLRVPLHMLSVPDKNRDNAPPLQKMPVHNSFMTTWDA
jgi:hypothetical protein